MSAYLVSQDTLNLIVNASDTPTKEAFDTLLTQNLASLAARYSDTDEDRDVASTYEFEVVEPAILVSNFGIMPRELPNQIVKSCRCYAYQCAGIHEWADTEAFKFVEQVRAKYEPLQIAENQAPNIVWDL